MLLISIVVHIVAIFWLVARPHNFGHHFIEHDKTTTLQVTLLPSENTKLASELPPAPSIEAVEKNEILLSLPALQDSDSFALPPTWYPANSLSRMPHPITQFTPKSVPGDDGSGGKISVRLWIDETGNLDHLVLLGSDLPKEFEEAALTAFHNMRFRPGEIDGTPVKAWVDIVIEYADLRRLLLGN